MAAKSGLQCALMAPTELLAEQHYQTFRARLAGFPVTVGLLSRFVPRARQKEVLKAAAEGQIDILLGTHRLLSSDVSLPNLSLLILDEEQRFGVRHKEKLKALKKNVDVLTLTATPIPRTLQLSMSGIRDLSVIETAPQDRKPVATAVLRRDDATLRTVLERELAREGQVFWVYNRVQGLERVAEYVRKLVPTARVGMAHGQMSESELESRIIDHLQQFLLELGTGFAFIGRQVRFTFDEEHFIVDLVFYNRLLRCFVLFDLKIGELKHQDIGQMQMYVNYYDRCQKLPDENPTIGILLCKEKNDAVVQMTLPENSNIFASEYSLYLPDKKILQKKLQEWIDEETGGEDD